MNDELKERARIEQAIRDLQLYIDVKWGGRNDMFNLALTALKDFCKLQAENEQLQAQVARMREALRKAREAIKAAWSDGSANAAMDKASEALAEIYNTIGGREDAGKK